MVFLPVVYQCVYLRHIIIGQEYVTGLGFRGFNMINTVQFFIRARELMLFDDAVVIVGNG